MNYPNNAGVLFIAAIKRDDLIESKLKHQKFISKHFITGRPTDLEMIWRIKTILLGYHHRT
ncbi:unnamed protein product [Callosobruchus maculatus]|uniref:Uncharacterized protein n=1 Tax=Callosobruchus maculatus TaxID=64391 RepID=A0A653BPW0_CALMS|nr:unnamed protein product [Callosobruchus maculatus]VEN45214.1 unnamed protein product [Callosobruchus maculatus]